MGDARCEKGGFSLKERRREGETERRRDQGENSRVSDG
jgi:hypothetical protein